MDTRVNTADDCSMSVKNLVNFGLVTPEFRRHICAGRAQAELCHASSQNLLCLSHHSIKQSWCTSVCLHHAASSKNVLWLLCEHNGEPMLEVKPTCHCDRVTTRSSQYAIEAENITSPLSLEASKIVYY